MGPVVLVIAFIWLGDNGDMWRSILKCASALSSKNRLRFGSERLQESHSCLIDSEPCGSLQLHPQEYSYGYLASRKQIHDFPKKGNVFDVGNAGRRTTNNQRAPFVNRDECDRTVFGVPVIGDNVQLVTISHDIPAGFPYPSSWEVLYKRAHHAH
ncbi:hypothetical protein CPB85DRAFT_132345 [Mucidula mucida]|nr:hypothetical protein CPB85DRAFT_132345 [Mucidula mucida]